MPNFGLRGCSSSLIFEKTVCQELVELELFGGRQHNNICRACDVLTIFRSEWLMVQAIMFMKYTIN